MAKYFILITFSLLIIMILGKVAGMKKKGENPIAFAKTHKSDLIIPPFALLCLYEIVAHVFDLPRIDSRHFFDCPPIHWVGVIISVAGLVLLAWALISFRKSFRIGIDSDTKDELVTTGAFGVSRNPIYVAFALNVLGVFLVFPCLVFSIFFVLACAVFHRQVLREEEFLKGHYGQEFEDYCSRVRRYL